MSDSLSWLESGGHPDTGLLLLHLEGELEGREAATVAAHVKDCWVCRAECQRLNDGMNVFVEYWEEVVQQTPVPPPSRRLPVRLRQYAQAGNRVSRTPKASRKGWLWGLVSAAVLAAFGVLSVVQPAPISAEELIARAQIFQGRIENRAAAVGRQIEIRQGDRSILRDIPSEADTAGAVQQAADPQIETSLREAIVNLADPLNAGQFASWRQRQTGRTDVLTEHRGFYTLTTTTFEPGPVASVSLTVQASNWRPVEQRIQFHDRPEVTIREVPLSRDPARTGAKSPARPVTADAAKLPNLAPVATPAPPSPADLDEAEVQLREALHTVRADIREAPQISRTPLEIRVDAFMESARRKNEVLEALRGIAYVRANLVAAGEGVPSGSISASAYPQDHPTPPRLYRSSPPLAGKLWEHFGGMNPANAYLAQERDSYLALLVDASALDRLAQRYNDAEWSRLPAPSRDMLDRIAADYWAALRSHAVEYLALVSPVLDQMGPERNALPANSPNDATTCGTWRATARPLVREIQTLQLAFRRLFVTEETDQPIDLSVENLLRQAAEARLEVRQGMNRTCPF